MSDETMPTHRIDVRVFDDARNPLPGAVIKFLVDGEAVGEVPNSEGHGSLEIKDKPKTIDIVVEYAGRSQQKRVAANVRAIEFTFSANPRPQAAEKLHPFSQGWFQKTVKAVPALKWALGIAAITLIFSVAKAYAGSPQKIILAVLVILGSSVLLVLFSSFVASRKAANIQVELPIKILLYLIVLLVSSSGIFAVSSLWFGWPIPTLRIGEAAAAPGGKSSGTTPDYCLEFCTDNAKCTSIEVRGSCEKVCEGLSGPVTNIKGCDKSLREQISCLRKLSCEDRRSRHETMDTSGVLALKQCRDEEIIGVTGCSGSPESDACRRACYHDSLCGSDYRSCILGCGTEFSRDGVAASALCYNAHLSYLNCKATLNCTAAGKLLKDGDGGCVVESREYAQRCFTGIDSTRADLGGGGDRKTIEVEGNNNNLDALTGAPSMPGISPAKMEEMMGPQSECTIELKRGGSPVVRKIAGTDVIQMKRACHLRPGTRLHGHLDGTYEFKEDGARLSFELCIASASGVSVDCSAASSKSNRYSSAVENPRGKKGRHSAVIDAEFSRPQGEWLTSFLIVHDATAEFLLADATVVFKIVE